MSAALITSALVAPPDATTRVGGGAVASGSGRRKDRVNKHDEHERPWLVDLVAIRWSAHRGLASTKAATLMIPVYKTAIAALPDARGATNREATRMTTSSSSSSFARDARLWTMTTHCRGRCCLRRAIGE